MQKDTNPYFSEVKKNFGFGCMRLPMQGEKVDYAEFAKMVDYFLSQGFNYFDTARVYLGGQSETALRDCLTSRYPRESFVFANKLSTSCFKKEEEIEPLFEAQLKSCGLEYFDFYLMHAQSREIFEKYRACRAYEKAIQFKKEGRIRHLCMSFHDKAEVLDDILTAYPEVEAVQIQLNYLDFEDPAVQSGKCYEVCRKHGKPMMIMEPVKGGTLANLTEDAKAVFDTLWAEEAQKSPEKAAQKQPSYASYAVRYAAGHEGVFMTLSGMSNFAQMQDNLSYMQNFKPLGAAEEAAVEKVCALYRAKHLIPCTACRYCTDGCPKHISIPDLFSCMNAKRSFNDWNADYYYGSVYTKYNGKASDCIKCGKCEKICPQHLPIRKLLQDVAREFEK